MAERDTIRLNLIGDVMLGELLENFRCGVKTQILRHGANPFEFCRFELKDADYTVANLECVVSDQSDKPAPFDQILKVPKQFASLIRENHIHVVNTANNHALDHGWPALEETIENLSGEGIRTIGYSPGQLFQTTPLVLELNGIRVGLVGYNLANFSEAQKQKRIEGITAVLKQWRPNLNALVVSLHWAEEYTDTPAPEYVQMAKRLFENGCDILHGHHSHRLQGVISVNGRLFAPSLGNFIFDDRRKENSLTTILKVEIGKSGVRTFEAVPYRINRRFQPVPYPAGKAALEELARKLQKGWDCDSDEEREKWSQAVARSVAAGHRWNRVRMRLLMVGRWYNYLGHLRPIVEMATGRLPRMFSVAELEV